MVKRIRDFCGDIKVNFWLIFAVSLNLAAGAYYIKFNPALFKSLNHSLVQNWFIQYGQYQPGQSWWIVLLFVLAIFSGTKHVCLCLQKNSSTLAAEKTIRIPCLFQ